MAKAVIAMRSVVSCAMISEVQKNWGGSDELLLPGLYRKTRLGYSIY